MTYEESNADMDEILEDVVEEEVDEQSEEPKGKESKKLLWVLFALTIALCVAFFGYKVIDQVTRIEYVDQAFNILVIGVDHNYGAGGIANAKNSRSDTLLLVMLPKDKKEATIISIPRDTLVTINGVKDKRVNSAFPTGGVDLVKQTVEELMGINIDRYVAIDFNGFEQLVDIIGGIEIDVDKRMRYTDVAGDLYIDLQPGLQMLNGNQALGYVRFRQDALGDIARVARQQKFLKAVVGKLMSWSGIKQYKKLLQLVEEYSISDLDLKDLIALGRKMIGFDLDKIDTYTLPGHFKDVYWAPNHTEIEELVNRLLYGEDVVEDAVEDFVENY